MKNIDLEVKLLLDKVYNLKSNDSVILAAISDEQKIATDNKANALKEKDKYNLTIKNVKKEIDTLSEEGNLLKDILSGINPTKFNSVLKKLDIDFKPKNVLEKLENNLPDVIDNLRSDLNTAKDGLDKTESELADVITRMADLDIRNSEAVVNQGKLAEYVSLALNGNVNTTRDSLIQLLAKFDLNNDEQREVAKLLMFPEDGLYQYDRGELENLKNGKSFSDVFAEAKTDDKLNVVNIVPGKSAKGKTKEVVPVVLDSKKSDKEIENTFEDLLSKIVIPEKKVEINTTPVEIIDFEPILNTVKTGDNKEVTNVPVIEPIKLPDINDIKIPEKIVEKEVPVEKENTSVVLNIESPVVDKNTLDIKKLLENNNFNVNDFTARDIAFIEEHIDEELFNKNVNKMNELGIKNDIFIENIELFIDDELGTKLDTLLGVGKVPFDIYLNPTVLVKYDASELNTSINALKESGLDPKKVPLMAY